MLLAAVVECVEHSLHVRDESITVSSQCCTADDIVVEVVGEVVVLGEKGWGQHRRESVSDGIGNAAQHSESGRNLVVAGGGGGGGGVVVILRNINHFCEG